MNTYEKAVAQIERKGNPVHSYAAVIVPLTTKAHKVFGTLEQDEKAARKGRGQRSFYGDSNVNERRNQLRIEEAQRLLSWEEEFYYDDPKQTEEDRKQIVIRDVIERLAANESRLMIQRDLVYRIDYDIEVLKIEK